jgi:hypothetical protein
MLSTNTFGCLESNMSSYSVYVISWAILYVYNRTAITAIDLYGVKNRN